MTNDTWQSGNPYELFMGRWSSRIAKKFLGWLAIPPNQSWVDVGCGTGSLTKQILDRSQPKKVVAIDSSNEFITHAQQTITNPSAQFRVGLAQTLPLDSSSMDVAVSGLMLNFVPQPETAISEMCRVLKPGGTIGIYLWDYAEGMEMLRYFWDAALELDKRAEALDEGIRFPICQQDQLESLIQKTGLEQVEAKPIEVTIIFKSFDDYWTPFLGKVGPAPNYLMRLTQQKRQKLEEKLRESLPINGNGSISLMARTWAVKGIVYE